MCFSCSWMTATLWQSSTTVTRPSTTRWKHSIISCVATPTILTGITWITKQTHIYEYVWCTFTPVLQCALLCEYRKLVMCISLPVRRGAWDIRIQLLLLFWITSLADLPNPNLAARNVYYNYTSSLSSGGPHWFTTSRSPNITWWTWSWPLLN